MSLCVCSNPGACIMKKCIVNSTQIEINMLKLNSSGIIYLDKVFILIPKKDHCDYEINLCVNFFRTN